MSFELTNDNYYSREANLEYMSVSQYKDFAGTLGKPGCEYMAMEKLEGRWVTEPSTAMQVGSYVDAYIEGTLDSFKENNPGLFKKDGSLKSDFVKAEEVIKRIERDEFFMTFLSGDKQVIMTEELFGVPWKIKMDSYLPGEAIVDLKVIKSITDKEWVPDYGKIGFIQYWGYDIQGAVYQAIVEKVTGKKLPVYIAAVTKEKEPNIAVIRIEDKHLQYALNEVESHISSVNMIKQGHMQPERCEQCDCCRRSKVLTEVISSFELAGDF